jgi:hypothetical protein
MNQWSVTTILPLSDSPIAPLIPHHSWIVADEFHRCSYIFICVIIMQSEGEGWEALSQVSCFMSHVEMRKSISLFGEIDATLDYCEYLTLVQIHKSEEPRLRSKKRKK